MSEKRDPTPAVGTPGEPWFGEKTGEKIDLHIGEWKDGRWSYLYKEDTRYAEADPDVGAIARAAAREARTGEVPEVVQGPILNAPVWTWEVPLYFWFGGIAAGSSFVALACDLAGDEHSATIARKVALAALMPSPPLLIMDLGRPERFYNMLRIFKPRSPKAGDAGVPTAGRKSSRGSDFIAPSPTGTPRRRRRPPAVRRPSRRAWRARRSPGSATPPAPAARSARAAV